MDKVVVDSSVIVKWINSKDELLLDKADLLMKKAENGDLTLIAVEFAKYEVGNAIIEKGMSIPQILGSMSALYALPIRFFTEDEGLSHSTLEIAQTYGITYYDAAPIALAVREGAVVVTDNFKHQGKARSTEIVSLKDF